MSKETAVTAHGEVEYQTVECDSCGNEIMKDDAERFAIGDISSLRYARRHRISETDIITGWACSYCYEQGPAGFPQDGDRSINQPTIYSSTLFRLLVLYCALTTALLIMPI